MSDQAEPQPAYLDVSADFEHDGTRYHVRHWQDRVSRICTSQRYVGEERVNVGWLSLPVPVRRQAKERLGIGWIGIEEADTQAVDWLPQYGCRWKETVRQ